MCSTSVLCPLCAVPSFNSIDALQQRLIKAANGPLACPFPQCKELFLGLDKLTIHLFSHTSLMTHTDAVSPATTTTTTTVAPNPSPPAAVGVPKRRARKSRARNTTATEQPTVVAPPTPPARCDICEFSFRNDELRDIHIRLVHENADEQLAGQPQQQQQQQQLQQQQQEPYKCHLCSKTFRMKGSLRVHLKVLHTIGTCSSSNNNNSNSHSCNSIGNGNLINSTPKISICDRIRLKEATPLANGAALAVAGNNSNGGSSSSSNNSNSNGGNTQPYALSGAICMLKQETPTHTAEAAATTEYGSTPKNWECDVCTKLFTTKYFLKKHKRLHTGEMPYTCQYCARTFTFQQSYHKHLLYHSEVKPHACNICGRAFKELSTLHNHQRIHSGEKPFKCEVCGKCFRQRVSFLVHTRIHTGVMPYKCEQCQKTFRYKVSLRTHKCAASLDEAQTPEQLIKALLESNAAADDSVQVAQSPGSATLAGIHMNGGEQEALLSQTIDDIVVESCQKLGICGVEPTQQQPQSQTHPQPLVMDRSQVHYDGSNSPLQQLQNLRLYSPQQAEQQSSDTELFQHFLMDAT